MATSCVHLTSTMRNSYDVVEIENYVILNTLQNFHFREYVFVFQFGLKTPRT